MCTKGSMLIFVRFPETFYSAFLPVRKVPCWFSSGFQKLSIQPFFQYERFHADFRPFSGNFPFSLSFCMKGSMLLFVQFPETFHSGFRDDHWQERACRNKDRNWKKKSQKVFFSQRTELNPGFFRTEQCETSVTILTCLLWWTKSFTLFFFIAFFLQYHS